MNEISAAYLLSVTKKSHEIACEKGWWGDDPKPGERKFGLEGEEDKRNLGEVLMLASSELAEALEFYRTSKTPEDLRQILWDDHSPGTAIELSKVPLKGGKPEGFGVELADFVIRLADNLAALALDTQAIFDYVLADKTVAASLEKLGMSHPEPEPENVPERLMRLNVLIAKAYEVSRVQSPIDIQGSPEGVPILMAEAIVESFVLAKHLGIDLAGAISIKSEYNMTRSRRHGGKRA